MPMRSSRRCKKYLPNDYSHRPSWYIAQGKPVPIGHSVQRMKMLGSKTCVRIVAESYAAMLSLFLTVLGVHVLAVMSPGPNILIIVKESVTVSRNNGLYTALGVLVGATMYVVFGFLGFIAIVSQSVMIFNAFKFIGALYLIYLGLQGILSSGKAVHFQDEDAQFALQKTPVESFRSGFLTNLSNPKAALYFFTLFTTFVPVDLPLNMKLLLAVLLLIISFSWYLLVAILFSEQRIQRAYQSVKRYADFVFGGLFISLGIRIAFGQR